MEKKFLLPGEFHLTRNPMELSTLLGSCVAMCLRNERNGAAAMNHFILPSNGKATKPREDIGRYGDTACAHIIRSLFRLDPEPRNYQLALYGGANVNDHLSFGNSVGSRNIEEARRIAREYGLRVNYENVGGFRGRKIAFDTATGESRQHIIGEDDSAHQLRSIRRDIASRNLSVLIVDDSSAVRTLLRKGLENVRGLEVIAEAENPYDARDKLLTYNPDVMLLDIIMPRMNGLDFLRKLSKYFPKPVVIVSTIAKAGSAIAHRASKYGAVEVVDKEELKLYSGSDLIQTLLVPKILSAFRRFHPNSA